MTTGEIGTKRCRLKPKSISICVLICFKVEHMKILVTINDKHFVTLVCGKEHKSVVGLMIMGNRQCLTLMSTIKLIN